MAREGRVKDITLMDWKLEGNKDLKFFLLLLIAFVIFKTVTDLGLSLIYS